MCRAARRVGGGGADFEGEQEEAEPRPQEDELKDEDEKEPDDEFGEVDPDNEEVQGRRPGGAGLGGGRCCSGWLGRKLWCPKGGGRRGAVTTPDRQHHTRGRLPF